MEVHKVGVSGKHCSPRELARLVKDTRAALYRNHKRGDGPVLERVSRDLGVGLVTLKAVRSVFETAGVPTEFKDAVDSGKVPLREAARAVRLEQRQGGGLSMGALMARVEGMKGVAKVPMDGEKETRAKFEVILSRYRETGRDLGGFMTLLDQVLAKVGG